MMIATTNTQWDFGALRGLSPETLALFNVRLNGAGWMWDTQTADGKTAVRWKSFYSQRPPGDEAWAKYRWLPEKPPGAKYFYPPGLSLTDAIADAWGALYLVGGEVAAMTLLEAGCRNVTCTFGDSSIPDTLLDDLRTWQVQTLYLVPDRDESGQRWACAIRDALAQQLEIALEVIALPYLLDASHGKDVNDYWLDGTRDHEMFREVLFKLPRWHLPEAVAKVSLERPAFGDEPVALPERFLDAIERALGLQGSFNSDGWSLKHVRCPFHDDATPSANWNRKLGLLRCHSACGTSYLAKTVGEHFNLFLRDYLDSTPSIPGAQPVLTVVPKTIEAVKPAAARKPAERKLRPALPAFAELSIEQEYSAATGRVWLDDYLNWATNASPLTPRSFHEAMALWLLATVSTRRMHCRIGAEYIYPNLYILIVGRTTIYRKSTAMKLVRSVLQKAGLSALLLPAEVTPEALFDELAGIKPVNFESLSPDAKDRWIKGRAVAAQRSFMKDEASSIFASLKRDYMAGLSELLLQGYDGDSGTMDKRLKSKGIITVKDLCLSFLGATTPIMYSKYVGNEEHENGFAARFALITPECDMTYRSPTDDIDVPPSIVTRLGLLFRKVLPWHGDKEPSVSLFVDEIVTPPSMHVLFSPAALDCLNGYRRALGWDMPREETFDESKAAAYARLGTMAFKVAMLLAAVDTDERPVRVEDCHAYAALLIVEQWRESLHRLDQDIAKAKNSGSDEDKVIALIRQSGLKGVTMREIMQSCNLRPRGKAVDTLTVLADEGLIEKYDFKPEGRGRPTTYFRISGLSDTEL